MTAKHLLPIGTSNLPVSILDEPMEIPKKEIPLGNPLTVGLEDPLTLIRLSGLSGDWENVLTMGWESAPKVARLSESSGGWEYVNTVGWESAHTMAWESTSATPVSQIGPQETARSEVLPSALINNWSNLAFSELSQRSYRKLSRICKKEAGWRGVGSLPLSAKSLRGFLNFWKLVRSDAVEPELSLSPHGHLVVEWHKNWRKHLDIEFCDDKISYFGLFDGKSVIEGVESINNLSSLLLNRLNCPLTWSE